MSIPRLFHQTLPPSLCSKALKTTCFCPQQTLSLPTLSSHTFFTKILKPNRTTNRSSSSSKPSRSKPSPSKSSTTTTKQPPKSSFFSSFFSSIFSSSSPPTPDPLPQTKSLKIQQSRRKAAREGQKAHSQKTSDSDAAHYISVLEMERFCLSNQTRVVINNSGNYRNKSLVSNRSLDVRQDNELVKVLEGKRYDVRRVSGSSLGGELYFGPARQTKRIERKFKIVKEILQTNQTLTKPQTKKLFKMLQTYKSAAETLGCDPHSFQIPPPPSS